jgi:predicted RNase H-like nuclease (RuvC/YqgF family)
MDTRERRGAINAALEVLRSRSAHDGEILKERAIIESGIEALTAGLQDVADNEKALAVIEAAKSEFGQLTSQNNSLRKENAKLTSENAAAKAQLQAARDETRQIAEREGAVESRENAVAALEKRFAEAALLVGAK